MSHLSYLLFFLPSQFQLNLIRYIYEEKGKIGVIQKKKGQWLAGQLELPTFVINCEDKSLNQYQKSLADLPENLPFINTIITKYKIKNYFLRLDKKSFNKLIRKNVEIYMAPKEDALKLLSTASIKVIKREKG